MSALTENPQNTCLADPGTAAGDQNASIGIPLHRFIVRATPVIQFTPGKLIA
jgi:hypothetical protein